MTKEQIIEKVIEENFGLQNPLDPVRDFGKFKDLNEDAEEDTGLKPGTKGGSWKDRVDPEIIESGRRFIRDVRAGLCVSRYHGEVER